MSQCFGFALIARCSCAFFAIVAIAQGNQAGFVQIGGLPMTPPPAIPHGMAFDGLQWHIANAVTDTFTTYTPSFTRLNDASVVGISDMRGLAFDSSTGRLFVGDLETTIVRQVTSTGDIISQFSGNGLNYLNALSYDPVTDTLWLAYFSNGVVENRTKTGDLLSSFADPAYQWTGLAIDPISRTLLLLETDDKVLEYKLDGTPLGAAIGTDQIAENGQGLAYDPSTGTLYASAQYSDHITVFSDPSRVIPEPSSFVVSAGLALAIIKCRRTKSAGS